MLSASFCNFEIFLIYMAVGHLLLAKCIALGKQRVIGIIPNPEGSDHLSSFTTTSARGDLLILKPVEHTMQKVQMLLIAYCCWHCNMVATW